MVLKTKKRPAGVLNRRAAVPGKGTNEYTTYTLNTDRTAESFNEKARAIHSGSSFAVLDGRFADHGSVVLPESVAIYSLALDGPKNLPAGILLSNGGCGGLMAAVSGSERLRHRVGLITRRRRAVKSNLPRFDRCLGDSWH